MIRLIKQSPSFSFYHISKLLPFYFVSFLFDFYLNYLPLIHSLSHITHSLSHPLSLSLSDDVQSMDHSSWGLLRHLWKSNTNISIVCSFRTFGLHSINYETESTCGIAPTVPSDGEINIENELKINITVMSISITITVSTIKVVIRERNRNK